MGNPNDIESQKAGRNLYRAFFNGADSAEQLMEIMAHRLPGMPFPASISGLLLDSGTDEEILDYLRPILDYLVKDLGLYPSILLVSVQAESPEKAEAIARKIKKIQALRDDYTL
jgi:hypothetical protein